MGIPALIAAVAPSLINSLMSGGGGAKAQNQALSRQMDLATQALNMQKRQFDQDLPFRRDLFSALRGRQQQQQPRFLPQAPIYQNPMQRRTMAQSAPDIGSPTSSSRGGFNARPGLTEALRERQQPQQLQQLLMRLLSQQGR